LIHNKKNIIINNIIKYLIINPISILANYLPPKNKSNSLIKHLSLEIIITMIKKTHNHPTNNNCNNIIHRNYNNNSNTNNNSNNNSKSSPMNKSNKTKPNKIAQILKSNILSMNKTLSKTLKKTKIKTQILQS